MGRNPVSAVSKTYKFKMTIFDNYIPEELLQFLNNYKKAIDGTATITVVERISFLHTLLHVEALCDYDNPEIKNNRSTNSHLK